jgi:hypothetical protein
MLKGRMLSATQHTTSALLEDNITFKFTLGMYGESYLDLAFMC